MTKAKDDVIISVKGADTLVVDDALFYRLITFFRDGFYIQAARDVIVTQ